MGRRVLITLVIVVILVGLGRSLAADDLPDCTVQRCVYLPQIQANGPTATPSQTATPTATATATSTATPTATPTATNTPVPTLPAVKNGGFELGNNGDWAAFGSTAVIANTGLGVTPRSGQWVARLGAPNTVSSLSQSFVLPAGLPAYLHFYYQIRSTQVCGVLPDFVRINVNSADVYSGSICATFNTADWMQFTLDLSSYAGQTVEVQLESLNYSSPAASSFYIDDVTLDPAP